MDLKRVFADVKKSFTVTKKVEFKEYGLDIEMEPLTSVEEVKVLESCKGSDGSEYVENLKRFSLAFAIKRLNGVNLRVTDVDFEDDGGKLESKSKYLFMADQIAEFPSSLRDLLFEVFQDMQAQLEDKIRKDAKFERFQIEEASEEGNPEEDPSSLKRVNEPGKDDEESMTDVEKEGKLVEKEIEQADLRTSVAEQKATEKV